MINLNNAEKQLLERHPSLATTLKFEEFAQLDQQIENIYNSITKRKVNS